jgi:8-oxo-dGTP diphosphatase
MTHQTAVYLVLEKANRVLFQLRTATGYRDGEHGLPSGKVESGELLVDAIVREASEEVGLELRPEDLVLSHLMERHTPTGNWLDFFFVCLRWTGQPVNAEPHKCREIAWLQRDAESISDYVSEALNAMSAGVAFSRYEGR